ncbi:MAG: cbb3-type cytochrome c oxidase subunit I [Bacteroidetes bacterium]|nr:cbb3-type cytochrome c oxidase subunit I [Bacteroidota bacterium]MCL6097013.1 cbb3-type cytochrome c oxidase subunit I [Bacteroidota bacterium]
MFSTVRYFIKTSIIFLVLGILTGLYMLIARNYFNIWPHPDLVSAHTHIILVGSVMMMIMGVALWFFPRAEKNDKLYKPAAVLAAYYIMTVSTVIRFASQIASSFLNSNDLWKFILTISACGQVLGIIIFFVSMWGRIRSVGSHIREAQGERF